MDVSLDSAWARLLAWLRRHGLWRRQFACIRQHSEEDCGAACVATVAAVHGRFWSLGAIRDAVGTTSNGTTLLGLRRGAEALGFHARAAKANPSILDELDSIPLPLICHWDQNHWVVLHGREHNSLLVADPAVGLVEFDAEAFLLHWQDGVILILEPDPARINSDHPAPSSGLWVLTRYISPFRPLLLQALILNAVIGLMALALPLLMQVLTDDVLVRGDQRMLTSLSLGLMVLFSFRSLLAFMQGHLVGYFAQKLQLQMIMHYGQRLLGLPIRYFETHRSGEVVSRIGDIQHLNGLITQVVMGLPSQLCIALISLALMWTYNSSLTIAALACFVFVLACNLCFLPAQHRKTQALLVNEAENQGFLVELFRGATVLKTSEATPQAWQEYQRNFGRLTRLSWQALRLELSENTVTTLLSSLTTIALLWYGSVFVIKQQLSIGQLLAFNGMGANVLGFLAGVSAVSQEVLKADVVIRRMADVLDREQEKSLYSGQHAVAIDSAAEVLCEDISYHHPGRRPLLEHLHLRLPGGVTTALIGESGCGKSTLSKIIAGLYPLQQGTIHYGQFSMRDLDIDDLRRQVVLIPQDSVVFNRTIFENFTFAHPNVAFAEVVEACRIALADDFIRELPEGYQTMLGEFGANLSGGQRQRLAIARALIGSPAILIMDESTSALDPILEARLMDRLLRHRAGQTTVIVSHRPSVILRADWIVYLEHGHVRDQNHVSALHESAFIAPFLGAA